jgi:hypothetical protein
MSGEPRSRRGLFLSAGVALAGAALVAAVLAVRAPSVPSVPAARRAAPVSVAPKPAPVYVAPAVDRPLAPVRQDATAKAMDAAGARQLVRALASAAASGNAPLKARMLEALGKHAASPRQVLEDELSHPQPPAVREAFQEALARCR